MSGTQVKRYCRCGTTRSSRHGRCGTTRPSATTRMTQRHRNITGFYCVSASSAEDEKQSPHPMFAYRSRAPLEHGGKYVQRVVMRRRREDNKCFRSRRSECYSTCFFTVFRPLSRNSAEDDKHSHTPHVRLPKLSPTCARREVCVACCDRSPPS